MDYIKKTMMRANDFFEKGDKYSSSLKLVSSDPIGTGEHLVLQAEKLGLGTCWIGWFNIRRIRKFFNIPPKYKIVSLLSMGYYQSRPLRQRKRKSLEEIVWFNRLEK